MPHHTSISLVGLISSPVNPPTTTRVSPPHTPPALQPRAVRPPGVLVSSVKFSSKTTTSLLKFPAPECPKLLGSTSPPKSNIFCPTVAHKATLQACTSSLFSLLHFPDLKSNLCTSFISLPANPPNTYRAVPSGSTASPAPPLPSKSPGAREVQVSVSVLNE